jgi:hypothetical protein
MTPEQFLNEEYENVKQALQDTLRYDYGDTTRDYYRECASRLDLIGIAIKSTRPSQIWARLNELSSLAVWISLIERSRLGEFSWPFSQVISEIAKPLLAEQLYGVTTEPIIHVVAEGEGYQIVYEEVPPASAEHRFAVVAFPRPLKHHVLLHIIFGHELGHTAQHTTGTGTGPRLETEVRDVLSGAGHLSSQSDFTAWLNHPNAPLELKNELALYASSHGQPYLVHEFYRERWLEELICDLFGLMLFGPGFAAAHQVLLRPSHPAPYEVELDGPTHPPYAVRHKMLARAIRMLKWDRPVIKKSSAAFHEAEKVALKYILDDPYTGWAEFFDDNQLRSALDAIKDILTAYGAFGYEQPNGDILLTLIQRLQKRLPPIIAGLDHRDMPILTKVKMAHTLYAGWIYWLGKSQFKKSTHLSFLETNKLCDQALLQERAMSIAQMPP